MLISPLMGPIMATGLALATGDRRPVSVSTVASQSELTELMARLAAPPPPPPKPPVQTIPEIDAALLARVAPVINSIWPPETPLQDFSLTFGSTGTVLNAHYVSEQSLGTIPLRMITRECVAPLRKKSAQAEKTPK